MWICPNCEEEIDSLDYSVEVREWGRAYLTNSDSNGEEEEADITDHEQDDSEWRGGVEYMCPECQNDVSLSELKPSKTEKEAEPDVSQLEEERFNIIKPEKELQVSNRRYEQNETDLTMICKHCLYAFVYSSGRYDEGEDFIDCPKCNQTNSRKEYMKLIESRHYENVKIKRIKKYAKKTKSRRKQLVG